jgi:hypothetical protein
MKIELMIILMASLLFVPVIIQAQEETCIVYFTGVGCPHCAKTDPVILDQMPGENPGLVIIEYEIYQKSDNANLLYAYNDEYDSGYGIPMVIFGSGSSIVGDSPILSGIDGKITGLEGNPCPLWDGTGEHFSSLDITALPGKPNIWKGERVLVSEEGGASNELLMDLMTGENISKILINEDYETIDSEPVPLSGSSVDFENAVRIGGWIFEWNGDPADPGPSTPNQTGGNGTNTTTPGETGTELSFAKIIGLAAVDAVNPCAFAVLSLMLIAIITYNPEKKRNVLLAGFAFVLSVFVMYMFYGLVIIRFFQVVQTLTSIRILLYQILGFAAIMLGILNIKDFVSYRPGGLGTEMPMRLRPKVKNIISGITSPRGAFIVGAFVTVFLLPCTIGPYVIAGGILSALELVKTIPWLLVYNLVFVLPMLAITFIVYAGMATVENVSEWKDKNIKYLHLVAGIIISLLGIAMLLGWV